MTSASTTPNTVCVTNAKGGTGKTTATANVVGALDRRDHDASIDVAGTFDTIAAGLDRQYDRTEVAV